MFGDYIRVNAAAHIENRADTHEIRMDRRGDVIENFIRYGFMKRASIAERPHVELERFEFDTELTWNIFNCERREIGLAGFRAQAGEFRDVDANRKIPAGSWVVEGFELCAGLCRHESIIKSKNKKSKLIRISLIISGYFHLNQAALYQ